jgi:hypothetical protein
MIPKWFNCGNCFYFKSNTMNSEDGRCYNEVLTEEVITVHFCSKWTCARCWQQGISAINHQICESISFAEDQLSKRPWDGTERRTGRDRRLEPDREQP